MDGTFPIIRVALGLVAASAVLAFALARRRRRTMIGLGLWAPVTAAPRGSKTRLT